MAGTRLHWPHLDLTALTWDGWAAQGRAMGLSGRDPAWRLHFVVRRV